MRGSEADVLDRFHVAAAGRRSDLIVRVTADDPLKDPEIIARAIKICRSDPSIERLQEAIAERLGYSLVDHRLELYAVPSTKKK